MSIKVSSATDLPEMSIQNILLQAEWMDSHLALPFEAFKQEALPRPTIQAFERVSSLGSSSILALIADFLPNFTDLGEFHLRKVIDNEAVTEEATSVVNELVFLILNFGEQPYILPVANFTFCL